jgi:hypothetical protein
MDNLGIYLAFFLGGLFFGSWLPAKKFMVFAVVVTIVYFFSLAVSLQPFGSVIGRGLTAFVLIQVGYVFGIGLVTMLNVPMRKTMDRFQVKPFDASKKTLD